MSRDFGFIHEQVEIRIKVLILFVMRRLPEPVSLDILTELTMCDESIGYFDVTECIAMLTETKHLCLKDGKYSLTAKGDRNGELLEKRLSDSVKRKAEEATAFVRAAVSRSAMIKTNCEVGDGGGYRVSMSFSDGIGDIMSMKLFASSLQQAQALERGFRKDAEKVYHAIIKMLAD